MMTGGSERAGECVCEGEQGDPYPSARHCEVLALRTGSCQMKLKKNGVENIAFLPPTDAQPNVTTLNPLDSSYRILSNDNPILFGTVVLLRR